MCRAGVTMLCSSGKKSGNGRPKPIPTIRSAAAPYTIATSARRRSPQALSGRFVSDLGWELADELGDTASTDDHRVDSGALELADVAARRRGQLRDGELAGGHVREQVEDPFQRLLVLPGEHEELGVELLQRVRELFVVLDSQRQLEVIVELDVRALDDVVAPAEPARPGGDVDDASVGAGQPVGGLAVPPEEDRHRDRTADLLELRLVPAVDEQPFGAL